MNGCPWPPARSSSSFWQSAWIVLIGAVVAAASCPSEEELPEDPIVFEGEPLEIGQTATYRFLADARWNVSPYIAYNGHRLRIEPAGRGLQIPREVIQFRIGRLEQIMSERDVFTVTRPGAIAFRLDPKRTAGFAGEVEVRITRLPPR